MKLRRLATFHRSFPLALAALLAAAAAHATQLYWDSNGTGTAGAGATPTGTWGTSVFWTTDSTGANVGSPVLTAATANTDDLYFVAGPGAASGNNAYTVTVSGAQVARGLMFQAAGATTISGGTSVTLGDGSTGGITLGQYAYGTTAQGAVNISTPLILNNSQTWTNNATNAISATGGLNNGGFLLTIGGSGAVSFAGTSNIITGAGGLTMNGTGTLILGAGGTTPAHNYSGPTVINSGVVMVFGNKTAGNFTLNGGLLTDYYRSTTTFSAGLGVGNNQIQIYGNSGFGGGNAGPSQWTIGAANSVLTWGSTYFNPTTLQLLTPADNMGPSIYGDVQLNNGLDLNGGARTIYVLAASGSGAYLSSYGNITGVIQDTPGGGSLIKTGGGNLGLTNTASTYTGPTVIYAGVLDATTFAAVNTNSSIGKGSTLGSAGDLVLNGGILRHTAANVATTNRLFSVGTSGGTIDSSNATSTNTLSFTGTGAMGFNSQLGTRTLTLTGTNTGNNTMVVLIANDGSANATSLTKSGTGTWIISGANTYTGPTTISAGTLSVGASNNMGGPSSNLVFDGGTLQITGATLTSLSGLGHTVVVNSGKTVSLDIAAGSTFTIDQVLGGTNGLVKAGLGTLVIGVSNSYGGPTTISGGTLQYNNGTAIPTTPLLNNATLVLNRTDALTQGSNFHSTIGGTGALTLSGAGGSLTLNGINTYTGATKVAAGTLILSHALAIQNSALDTTGAGTVTLSGVTTPTFGGLTASGTVRDLASVITSGYTGVTALTLNPAGAVTYGGVLANGASGMTLTMAGAGTQTLQGVDTYSGATILKAGTLELSGSGSILNSAITLSGGGLKLTNTAAETGSGRVNDSTAITSNGGTLIYNNTSTNNIAYAETVGSVALTSGQLNIVEAVNQTGTGTSSQTLTLGGLTHTGGTNTSAVTITAATTGPNAATNKFVVTGASATSAGQIIGPWATTGTAANALTDYAIYNGSAQVVPAAITASAESAWTTAANAYTANAGLGGITLTGTRNITALRSISATNTASATSGNVNITLTAHTYAVGDAVVMTGAAPTNFTAGNVYYVVATGSNTFQLSATPGGAAISPGSTTSPTVVAALLLSSGNNLGTTGILNGVATTLTIAATGTGAVTLPTTGADSLHVNAGSGAITINAPVTDNTGALTLVKDGSGTLTLSGTNTYTGGTVINGGALTLSNQAAWGNAGSRNITFNGSGTLTGADAQVGNQLSVSTGATATFTAANLTFATATGSGTIIGNYSAAVVKTLNLADASGFTGIIQNLDTYAGCIVAFGKLSDSASLQFAGGSTDSNQQVIFQLSGDAGSLTLNTRQIQLLDKGAYANANRYYKLQNNNATPANTWIINTALVNNVASRAVEFQLGGTNTGNNEFHGTIGNGANAVSLTKADAGTWILSGANTYTGATTLSGGILSLSSLDVVANANPLGQSAAAAANLLLADGTTLKYTGAAATCDRLFTLNTTANSNTVTLDASGTGAVNFSNTGSVAYGTATSGKTRTLALTGTNTGSNTLAAAIADNGVSTVAVTKSGAGTWVLSGASTYTGTTTVSAGTLGLSSIDVVANANPLGKSSSAAGNLLLADGTTLQYTGAAASCDRLFTLSTTAANGTVTLDASGTAPVNFSNTGSIAYGTATANKTRTLALTGNNTGANTLASVIGDNGVSLVSLTKSGTGTWVLSGSNTYSGTTTVTGGTLRLTNTTALSTNTTVYLTTGAGTLDLAFTGTNRVMALYINGIKQPNGSYGASTAPITGTGFLWAGPLDSDGDGIPDSWMLLHFGHPTGLASDLSRAGDDPDGDGLTNLQEYQLGTDPKNPDTDGDGLSDGDEVNIYHTDPLKADTDGDGLTDGEEVLIYHTDPLKADTDGDGVGDWYEVKVSFTDPLDPNSKPKIPYPLPKPDGSTGATNKPVKVYIMSGQSNMVGEAQVNGTGPGTLNTVVKTQNKFPHVMDINGNWSVRNDVMYRGVITALGNAPLTVGQGASSGNFGPELGFGHVMGYYHDEPVLLLKASQGNRGLFWDLLPPGSPRFTSGGTVYAGYGEGPNSWATGGGPSPYVWYAGKQYDDFFLAASDMGCLTDWANATSYGAGIYMRHNGVMYTCNAAHTSSAASEPGVGAQSATYWTVYSVINVTTVLDNFATQYPQWAAQGFVIAGYVWFQGNWDIQNGALSANNYEANLTQFIKQLRSYYANRYPGKCSASTPFVLSTGCGDPGTSGNGLIVANAQIAVGNPTKHPEFAGTVKCADTRPYWPDPAQSPTGAGYHYYGNAEAYLKIGDALGRAMIDMVGTTPTGYAAWAATNAPTGSAKDDYDGDGVSNGVEYVLGGTKTTNDSGKLPKVSTSGGNLLFTFTRDQKSIDGATTVTIEVGSDLVTWPETYTVPDGAAANNPGVTVVKDSPTTGYDTVTLTVPQLPDTKQFARLKVLMPSP